MKRTTLVIAIAALCSGVSAGVLAQDNDAEHTDEGIEQPADAANEEHANGDQPESIQGGDEQNEDGEQQDDLSSYQLSKIEGMTVVNQQDEDVGNIQSVVEHKESGDLYAIVSIGGVWNIGDSLVALPLDELTLQDDQLVTNSTYGSDEIEASAEKYDEDNFSQIDNEMTVIEVLEHPNTGEND